MMNMKSSKRTWLGTFLLIVLAFSGCCDPCKETECYNGGICVDGSCTCPEGWTGEDCSIEVVVDEPVVPSCAPVDFNGYVYEVIEIGEQCWFAENLRTDQYTNGDPIPGDLPSTEWVFTSSGAQTIYGEGSAIVESGSVNEVANLEAYGRLYNWFAVDDARGLCPLGWHVPSDEEWMTLEMELGMSASEAQVEGYRGTDEADQMKATPEDVPPWDGTNSSGFSALPAGTRAYYTGNFRHESASCFWWTSTPFVANAAWHRNPSSGSGAIVRTTSDRHAGFSVRCLKD